jgi:two-component system, response regulator
METTEWILLAENDPDDSFLIKRILEQACPEYEVVTVEDGSAALRCLFGQGEFADRFTGPPAVMILDHAMPGHTGLTVLKTVREGNVLSWIPVVMCSGMMTRVQVQEAYRLGANAYVEKPCDFDQLNRVFQQLGMFWTQTNVTPSSVR